MGSGASRSRKKEEDTVVGQPRVTGTPSTSINSGGRVLEEKEDERSSNSREFVQREKLKVHKEGSNLAGEYVDPDLLLDDEGLPGLPGLESDDEGDGSGEGSDERHMMQQNQENWSMLKHSLEMSGEDLLLNMLYFSDEGAAATVMEDSASMGKVLDGAMTETLALHSENNTPYKLKPASKEEMEKLQAETLDAEISGSLKVNLDRADSGGGPESKGCGLECVVCKEELELGDKIMRLPQCGHTFHEGCLSTWFQHQDWCPICRTSISGKKKDEEAANSDSAKKAAGDGIMTISTSSSSFAGERAHIAVDTAS